MKILANDGISAVGKEKLEAHGFTVVTDKVDQNALADTINNEGYVALLVRSATTARKELIDACPGLKFIGRGGVGMDNIDVDYAREKGLKVQNTPAASSDSVGELVMGHLYSCARHLHDSNRQMPESGNTEFKVLKKKYAKGVELAGKTLGVVGIGRIGQATAKRAIGVGMRVIVTDPYAQVSEISLHIHGVGEVKAPVEQVEMDELLAQSDFITLHVPKQDDGSAVIGADEIKKMKDGASIVNAARGGVVDEDALMAALDAGKLRYAALDVFENEPTPREDVLKHKKIALTPHIGAATGEAQDRIGLELADHLIQYFKG
ncbi:MAG: D-2-hydroxyacid dehydrogenase [Flavobacteriales bacterium]|nr:D-2-hydroxyacid dehydrogenase [Flavobacteriales bacterium]